MLKAKIIREMIVDVGEFGGICLYDVFIYLFLSILRSFTSDRLCVPSNSVPKRFISSAAYFSETMEISLSSCDSLLVLKRFFEKGTYRLGRLLASKSVELFTLGLKFMLTKLILLLS